MSTVVTSAAEPDPAAAAPPAVTDTPYRCGLLASLALGILVALGRLDELSGRVPTTSGRSWSLEQLMGPAGPGTLRSRWLDAAERPPMDLLPRLATVYLVLDVGLVLLYASVVWVLAKRAEATRPRLRRVLLASGAALALLDLTENALAWFWIDGGTVSPAYATTLSWVTLAKWVAVAALVGLFGREVLRRLVWPPVGEEPPDGQLPATRRWLRDSRFALIQHRLTLAPVLVLFVLSVLSGSQVLDQLPDAQREWVSNGGQGVWHALVSMLLTAGLAVLLTLLGRLRSEQADEAGATEASTDPPPRSVLLGWFLVPLIIAVPWLLIALTGPAPVQWGRLLVVTFVCWGVFGVSFVLRRRWEQDPTRARYRPAEEVLDSKQRALYFVGDAIGIAVVTVGGLSLIRSFVPMLGLGRPATLGSWSWFGVWVLSLFGFACTVLPWFLALALRRLEQPYALLTRRPARRGKRAVAGAAIVFLVGMALLPNDATRFFGVAGTATICIGGLSVLAATLALVVRHGATPEVFRLFGFRSTPVLALFVVTVLLVSGASGRGTLHHVRSDAASIWRPEARPTLDEAFQTWVSPMHGPAGCESAVAGSGVTVRPMLMVAAEGGGIRAAYWAVGALDRLDRLTTAGPDGQGCGAHSTLFSGGASGGSVGLTVSRFSDDPMSDVKSMAEPDVLAAAVAGTFVRDPVYGLTGVPLMDLDRPPVRVWRDRAQLIEEGWDGPDPSSWGRKHFLSPHGESRTGALILNTTSVQNNCRGWISQMRLRDTTSSVGVAGRGELTCGVVDQVAPRTIDVLAAYSRTAGTDAAEQPACWGDLRASTAALLTARFPYVTPSGVVGPCPPRERDAMGSLAGYWPRTQLIDGGYIENSGIATITDLAPQWSRLVRQHNATVLRDDAGALVVPVVVYLTNDTQAINPADRDRGPTSELAVPPVNALRGLGALNQTRALLERARGTVDVSQVCPDVPGAQLDCPTTVAAAVPYRVVVVDRAVRPEISAPLGWTLSDASTASLDEALDDQAQPTSSCAAAEVSRRSYDADCQEGFGRLSDLVRQLGVRQP